MKKTIHIRTGRKEPGEHWKEVEAEVRGPFGYYEVELEQPTRTKLALVHVKSGTFLPKRTSAGLEPPPYGGVGGSSEYYWPSVEFVERTIAKVREATTDRQWRFEDPEEVSKKKIDRLVSAVFEAERAVKAEFQEEFLAAKVARRESKEAKAEDRRLAAEKAARIGKAIYVLLGGWEDPKAKTPTPIVKQYGDYIALHRGLSQWKATSWWYVSHIPTGTALYKSKSKRLAMRAAALFVEEHEAFWRFKNVDRLSSTRRAAVFEKVRAVREAMKRGMS